MKQVISKINTKKEAGIKHHSDLRNSSPKEIKHLYMSLSLAEKKIFILLAKGFSAEDISRRLLVPEHLVNKLRSKMQVNEQASKIFNKLTGDKLTHENMLSDSIVDMPFGKQHVREKTYLTKRALLNAAKTGIAAAARETMLVQGFNVIAEDGWVIKLFEDGTREKIKQITKIVPSPNKILS